MTMTAAKYRRERGIVTQERRFVIISRGFQRVYLLPLYNATGLTRAGLELLLYLLVSDFQRWHAPFGFCTIVVI